MSTHSTITGSGEKILPAPGGQPSFSASISRWLVPAALLLFSAAMAVTSKGFLEADEITHFVKAREMWTDWRAVLDIWGRPACTGFFALAAPLGLASSRLLAVGITALVACGAQRLHRQLFPTEFGSIARNAGVWIWLLLYAQPMVLMNSFTVMTEMLLACSWIWAAVLLARGRTGWAGWVAGVGGLARPEGWFAIAVWPAVVYGMQTLARRSPPEPGSRLRAAALSTAAAVLPVLMWWLLGIYAYRNPRWMIDSFPWQTHSQYGKTGLLFIASALVSLALWMWIPVAGGAVRLFREKRWMAVLLVAAPAGSFYLLHAVMGTFGLMGSMSLPRYFVSVSPFLAILGVVGLTAMEARWRRPQWMRRAVLALVFLPVLMLVAAGQLPVSPTTDMLRMDVALKAYERRAMGEQPAPELIAGHPYVYYRGGLRGTAAPGRAGNRQAILTAPIGTMVITDAQLWQREGFPTAEQLSAMGYRLDRETQTEISRVPEHWDVTTLFPTGGHVSLWVKER